MWSSVARMAAETLGLSKANRGLGRGPRLKNSAGIEAEGRSLRVSSIMIKRGRKPSPTSAVSAS